MPMLWVACNIMHWHTFPVLFWASWLRPASIHGSSNSSCDDYCMIPRGMSFHFVNTSWRVLMCSHVACASRAWQPRWEALCKSHHPERIARCHGLDLPACPGPSQPAVWMPCHQSSIAVLALTCVATSASPSMGTQSTPFQKTVS